MIRPDFFPRKAWGSRHNIITFIVYRLHRLKRIFGTPRRNHMIFIHTHDSKDVCQSILSGPHRVGPTERLGKPDGHVCTAPRDRDFTNEINRINNIVSIIIVGKTGPKTQSDRYKKKKENPRRYHWIYPVFCGRRFVPCVFLVLNGFNFKRFIYSVRIQNV